MEQALSFQDKSGIVGSLDITHLRDGKCLRKDSYKNLVMNLGREILSGSLINLASHFADQLRIGTNADNSTDPAQTALGAQTHASGAITKTQETTAFTGDTAQFAYTFAFGGPYLIKEAGLFVSTSSLMVARKVFTEYQVVSGDSLLIQWKFQC